MNDFEVWRMEQHRMARGRLFAYAFYGDPNAAILARKIRACHKLGIRPWIGRDCTFLRYVRLRQCAA